MTALRSETFNATLRSLRASERFAVGRRILSLVALGVLSSDLEPGARRALRESAGNTEMGVARGTLLGLAQAIEDRNPALAGVFSEVLVNDAVHSRSLAETLLSAMRVVTDLGANVERQAFGIWFSAQLDEIVSVGQTGEIGTSRAMAHVLTALARIEPGQTVYDPCCGLGGLLAYAWSVQPNATLLGNEIHPISWALASLRLHLLGAEAQIRMIDSLAGIPPRADRVICDPPFGPLPPAMAAAMPYLGLDPNLGRRSFESAFITHCLAALPSDGRATILVSESFLVRRGAEEDLRRFLVAEDVLEGIVSVSSKVAPWISHELAVIVLRGAPSDDDSVRMVDASRVLSDHRSRSRLDWAPMADVVAAYFTPLDVQGAMTVASQNVLGPGRFRPLQHFTSTFDRPSLVDLIRQAAVADAEAETLKSKVLDTLKALNLSLAPPDKH